MPTTASQYTVPAAFSNRVNVTYNLGPPAETPLPQAPPTAAVTTYLTPETQPPKQTISPPQIVQPAPPPQVKKGLSLTVSASIAEKSQETFLLDIVCYYNLTTLLLLIFS